MKNIEILQNLTNAQLAELNHCSVSTIKRHKRKYNICTRDAKYLKYLEITKKYKYNNVELAKLLQCSIASIHIYHNKAHQQSSFSYEYNKISRYEYTIFIGTLLGDAWLTKSSNNSYRGGFAHKEQNLDYIKYKYNLLQAHCTSIRFKRIDKTKGNSQYVVRFKANPEFKNLHKVLYKNGKKKITNNILKYFTEQSLALFYQDDGSKIKSKCNYFGYKIAMYGFDKESKKLFQDFLFLKWGLKTSISSDCLRLLKPSILKFKYLIKPYIVPSMLYKL